MVLAPIVPARAAELRELLESMNHAPGRVNADNSLVPFGRFTTLHFARFVILDDLTTSDIGVYDLPAREYPLYLVFLGDVDGSETAFSQVASRMRVGRFAQTFFPVARISGPIPIC